MKNFINYQGSKAGIIDFIISGIKEYTYDGDVILDIFAGSSAVSSALNSEYIVYANDVEPYAASINSAILCPPLLTNSLINEIEKEIYQNKKELIGQENLKEIISNEKKNIKEQDLKKIIELYKNHKTVWNSKEISPKSLRKENLYNLFIRYYGGTYFGIEQAVEIDSIIKCIHKYDDQKEMLFSCLFYAIKETVFSRDGHMAQPLNFTKNSKRGYETRKKSVIKLFLKMCNVCINEGSNKNSDNKVFNKTFESLIQSDKLLKSVDLIYADPPYTDMQYSRYYHILNVAKVYDYPELTKTNKGFTSGLYTEGRFQSDLSKKSKAKSKLKLLMQKCEANNINLALSYAYPQNIQKQATDRYTVSIEELIEMAKSIFSPERVKVNQIKHSHTNHKNSSRNPVIEYLLLCGKNKKQVQQYDIPSAKKNIQKIKPTNRNPIYNTHLYWSQKSYNIIDSLIESFTKPGDIIFDPFMGSGVTILEAIKKEYNRNAVGCDINEMPIFIVRTILDYSFMPGLEDEIKKISENILSLNKYYKIKCIECDSNAIIERIVFDKPNRNSNVVSIKSINIECNNCNKYTLNTEVQQYSADMFKKYNYKNIDENFKYIKNSKIAIIENDRITNIFTPRNLKVIDEILTIANKESCEVNNVIKYVLMSVLHQLKITDTRSNSQWPLWTPKKNCVERNVIILFEKKLLNYIKAIKKIKSTYIKESLVSKFSDIKNGNAYILHKPSQLITDDELPNNTVDLIITDPPYLEQVLYSEYMQLYAPILGLDFNLKDEIVVSSGENRNKTKDNYYSLLKEVFTLCRDKLKKNKLMCLYFHDSNLDVWYRLIKILYELGFDFKGQVHIKKNSTLKNIISPRKSLNGDSLLFFHNTKIDRILTGGNESIKEIETNIVKEAKYLISNYGSMTTTELYDNGLMEVLITNGWLQKMSSKYKSLIDVFEKHLHWDKSLGKWYIAE